MSEVIAVKAPVEEDLSRFSQFLWQQNISHRLLDSEQEQWLLVGSDQHAKVVAEAYHQVKVAGKSYDQLGKLAVENSSVSISPQALVSATPLTFVLIVLSLLGYALVSFDPQLNLMKYLTFYEYERIYRYEFWRVPTDQYWRLITPIFLHFGLLHITFNMLWFWDLGRRVEMVQGSLKLLGITMTIGLGSNIAQYIYAEKSIFGGMSGVIYGLLGYCWLYSKMRDNTLLEVPRPVMIFMMVSLVACIYGFAELLGVGKVANAAHVGGLVMGLIMGFAAALIDPKEKA